MFNTDMPLVAPQLSDITPFERRRCSNGLADRMGERRPFAGEENNVTLPADHRRAERLHPDPAIRRQVYCDTPLRLYFS